MEEKTNNLLALCGSRRFMPLFVTQFFGAFNDNYLKCAILTMVTFMFNNSPGRAGMLTNLAMALFILPYFLFSAAAGTWVDSVDKARCCRIVKMVEIVLMALAAVAFFFRLPGCLILLLFCMGTQSTFFGPAKYSLLPQHLKPGELVDGNALIEGGTYIAILSGSIGGSIIVALPGGMMWSGGLLFVLAVVGFAASCMIPQALPASTGKITWNIVRDTWTLMKENLSLPVISRCMMVLSMFWMAGALLVSMLPVLVHGVVGGNELVNTFLLTLFSIGIALGSLAASLILNGKVSGKLGVVSMIGMALCTLDLAWGSRSTQIFPEARSLMVLWHEGSFWRITLNMLGVSFFGGMFSVPLQAMMQFLAPQGKIARVIAANNVINALFMALGTVLAAAASFLWSPPPGAILAVLGAVLLLTAYWTIPLNRNAADPAVNQSKSV